MFDLRKVRRLRRKRGMTQAELHRLTGLTIGTISEIENGHRIEVKGSTIEKLAKALKVKPAELLK